MKQIFRNLKLDGSSAIRAPYRISHFLQVRSKTA